MRQGERSWREVVAMMREAGRGLAAAHRSGLVHRDFKPDNVLVGRDGRARVTDFGLARASQRNSEVSGQWSATTEEAVVGTPAYMAPEQACGEAADARSDQYSLCASLFEMLYGRRPHDPLGEEDEEAPRVIEVPKNSRVPAWVARIVLRGLSADPGQRFGSVDELVEALGRDPAVARRRWLGGVATVALTLGLGLSLARLSGQRAALCRTSAERLAGVWDEAVKERIERAFMHSGAVGAAESWARTATWIDRYASDWVAMRTDACEATRVRGEQSDEVMSLRMICLDQRLGALRAQVEVLKTADAPLVGRAVAAAQALPPLAECGDIPALRAPARLPADRAARERIAALRQQLARGSALYYSGRIERAEQVALGVAKAVERERYRPLQGEVHFLLGRLLWGKGDLDGAVRSFRLAARFADAGRDDARAAQALAASGAVLGEYQGRYREGEGVIRDAQLKLERVPGEAVAARAFVLRSVSALDHWLGRYREDLETLQRVVTLLERAQRTETRDYGTALLDLSASLAERGIDPSGTLRLAQRARDLLWRVQGGDDPASIYAEQNLAEVLLLQGRWTEAEAQLERAERQLEKRMPHHPWRIDLLNLRGQLLLGKGRPAEAARVFQKVLAELKEEGEAPAAFLAPLVGLGESLVATGQFKEAMAFVERAREITDQGVRPPRLYAQAQFIAARALWGSGGAHLRARELAAAAKRSYLDCCAGLSSQIGEIDDWLAQRAE